ncbi:MAG: ycii-related protein [Bacteroidetes bacterium]|nr:MAG: ycii-related protein [Bacteroidota bacterium]
MKKLLFTLLIILSMSTLSYSQNTEIQYDSVLAQKLGADVYGMKSYFFVLLKTGSFVTNDKVVLDSLFRGHMKNISKLAESNKLVVAGPYGKNDLKYRGLFILNVTELAEAKELLKGDPAISSGLFDVEIVPWYGSAALPVYLETHKKIAAQNP